jgi:hypothetical protein
MYIIDPMISEYSSRVCSEQANITLNRPLKQVKFQAETHTFLYSPSEDGLWHTQASLLCMRDAAIDTAIQSRVDPRYVLWNTLFQDPASESLLYLWTTNSNTLRGLEQFACDSLRRQRIMNESWRFFKLNDDSIETIRVRDSSAINVKKNVIKNHSTHLNLIEKPKNLP